MFRHHNTADDRSGGASKRLSARFGIPEKEVNDLLYGRTEQSATADPLSKGELRMPTPAPEPNRWGPASVLAALLGVAGILALIILMMVVIHHHHEMERDEHAYVPPPIMQAPPQAMVQAPSVQPPVPMPPADSQHGVPNTASNNALSSNTPSSNTPSSDAPSSGTQKTDLGSKPKKAVHHRPKGYSTTSDMDAEEHLAELRADGNARAEIHTSKKNGVTTYTVR